MNFISVWEKSEFDIPNILFAVNENTGETYIVIEDNSTIFRLMNKIGQIYVVAGFRCREESTDEFLEGMPYYMCQEPIHSITCSKIDLAKDKFVLENFLKYL